MAPDGVCLRVVYLVEDAGQGKVNRTPRGNVACTSRVSRFPDFKQITFNHERMNSICHVYF